MASKKKVAKKKVVKKKTSKKQTTNSKSTAAKNKKNKANTEQATMEEDVSKESSEKDRAEHTESAADDLLGGLANKATKIVQQAASILEEEIAAGIIAAKNVEERYVDVSNIRAGDSEQVMQRFRKDAHEVVDILIDLVNVSINSLGGLTRRVVSVQSSPGSKRDKGDKTTGAAGISILMIPGPLKKNETGEVSMSVENDSDTSTEEFTFKCADLLSPNDDSINRTNIQFCPDTIVVGPNTFEKIVVTLKVPGGTKPGTYSGLLQATKLSHVQVILTVVVE